MSFDVNHITRKTQLEHDDSISCYLTHCAQQSDKVYHVFYEFIRDVKPIRILEIGTAAGGFTAFLKLMCDECELPTKILSYDIKEPAWTFDGLRSMGVDVRVENVFNQTYTQVSTEVQEFIKEEGVTIVLCDGGWKIGEFNILSNYLKVGDFILAHDYAETREQFQQHMYKQVWNWMEIGRTDINNAMEKNNLIKYRADVFESVAWVCTQKTQDIIA